MSDDVDCMHPGKTPPRFGPRRDNPQDDVMPSELPGAAQQPDGRWAVFDASGYKLRDYADESHASAFLDGLTYTSYSG